MTWSKCFIYPESRFETEKPDFLRINFAESSLRRRNTVPCYNCYAHLYFVKSFSSFFIAWDSLGTSKIELPSVYFRRRKPMGMVGCILISAEKNCKYNCVEREKKHVIYLDLVIMYFTNLFVSFHFHLWFRFKMFSSTLSFGINDFSFKNVYNENKERKKCCKQSGIGKVIEFQQKIVAVTACLSR